MCEIVSISLELVFIEKQKVNNPTLLNKQASALKKKKNIYIFIKNKKETFLFR